MIGIGINVWTPAVIGARGEPVPPTPGIATPSITSPAEAATDVSLTPTFTSSAFAVTNGGSDTHASSDWQVASDSGFTSIVQQSLDDATNKTSWTPSALTAETVYYVRVRHAGTTYGDSAWSTGVSFETAVASSYSAEAEAYFARLAVQPSAPWKTLIDDLITTLVADAVYTELDALCLCDLPDAGDSTLNIIAANNQLTVVAATHAEGGGFTSTGSGLSLTATFTQLTQNDAHFGVWQTATIGSGEVVTGTRLSMRNRTGSTLYRIGDIGAGLTPAVTTPPAHIMVRRGSSSSRNVVVNGTQQAAGSETSTGAPAASISFLVGSGIGMRAWHMGGNLDNTKAAALYAALATYIAGVDAL